MAILTVERVSAVAAVVAALFAGYSGYVAHQTMSTSHQDAVEQLHQSRAYVGIQLDQRSDPDKAAWWIAQFKAIGGTPALNVKVKMKVTAIDDDASVEPATIEQSDVGSKNTPNPFDAYLIENALLLPGSSQAIPLEAAKPVNFKPHQVNIFFGTVTYNDVFNQHHETHFCIRLGQFCNIGNNAN